MSNNVGFVILTWNSEKCIGSCLDSILSINGNDLGGNIVIVDNGSTDQTRAMIQKVISKRAEQSSFSCKVIHLEKNYGTTISRNIGIKDLMREDVSYICILDSDTVVTAGAISTLIATLKEDASIGIIGPRLKSKDGTYQHSGRNLPTLTEKLLKVLPIKSLQKKGERMELGVPVQGVGCTPVGYLLSACWMMRKTLPAEIGLLDERIFYAPEDVEYCIRCQKAGKSVQYCYDAEIIHEWQRLSRKKLFSKHNFEHIKGLSYLFWKHGYLFSTKALERRFAARQVNKREENIKR